VAREPWNILPAKKRVTVSPVLKAEVETKAQELIDTVLRPRHVQPPPKGMQFNYITDITAAWYRGYFYFTWIYACPGPNAITPSFEWKFARLEPLRGGTFALYAMRHTGKEWIGVLDALTLDEAISAIRDDEWFQV
jgi:hypothetical protein